jgi:hypothetical protein
MRFRCPGAAGFRAVLLFGCCCPSCGSAAWVRCPLRWCCCSMSEVQHHPPETSARVRATGSRSCLAGRGRCLSVLETAVTTSRDLPAGDPVVDMARFAVIWPPLSADDLANGACTKHPPACVDGSALCGSGVVVVVVKTTAHDRRSCAYIVAITVMRVHGLTCVDAGRRYGDGRRTRSGCVCFRR